nr:angiopoietin-4-like [Aedes albopictus]
MEDQLKKTLQQVDDQHLLAKIDEIREELTQGQASIRTEFSSTLTNVGQVVSREFTELRNNMDHRFETAEKRLEHLVQKQDELVADHESLASTLIEIEQSASDKFVNISYRLNETYEHVQEVIQNQENSHTEFSSKLTSVVQDLNHNFNLVMSNVVEGFENADNRFDHLMQTQADLVTGYGELTSTLTKMEQHVSEQFVVTLTNITGHFDSTNDQIEDLAMSQNNTRLELSSKLTNMQQNMTNNFNSIVSTVNEGFSNTDVRFDYLAHNQNDLVINQQAFLSTLTIIGNDVVDKFTIISANINERSDKLEDQHRTTKDQLDRLLQNMDNHRVEFATVLTRIEQSTNQNFVTVTNYAAQILQQQETCSTPQQPLVVTSCKNALTSGQYQLKPFGTDEVLVGYCEQEKFNGGWLVIQHRFDGSVDFHRSWNEYKNGFGSIGGEFWFGLDKIHRLTKNKNVELIVELMDYSNKYIYARYDLFEIGSESQKYSLDKLGSYSGTAGDSMMYNRGQKFSTKDKDNDGAENLNCAVTREGAWWYNFCGQADLNGQYGVRGDWRSIFWYGYNQYDGMKYTRMMIREM